MPPETTAESKGNRARLLRPGARLAAFTAAYGALLFFTAGTVAWPEAWAYLALMVAILVTYSVILARVHPTLVDERQHPPTDAKAWDKPLVALVGAIGPVAMVVLCGLDRRLGWSPAPPAWLPALGFALVAVGGALTNWAVASNPFFSALVRIQRDRGHRVVDGGPYRFVRHPGYVGSIATMVGVALLLGSRPGLALAAALTAVTVVRTALEDRTLAAELEGYAAYAARVRWRLVPFAW
jgi:protein-S-isoprenylcysteine O-methyltransferase Ste14